MRRKPGSRITRKQTQAIVALFEHGTIKHAAQAVKLSERTLRRWLRDPDFASELAKTQTQYRNHTIGLLSRYSVLGAIELGKILVGGRDAAGKSDGTISTAARIAAAKAVIELSLKGAAAGSGTIGDVLEEPVMTQEQVLETLAKSVSGSIKRESSEREAT